MPFRFHDATINYKLRQIFFFLFFVWSVGIFSLLSSLSQFL